MGIRRLTLKCRLVNLVALDHLFVDALALLLFREDRLLKGAAGYCDWRLNGRISQMIRSGLFSGKLNEALLMDTTHRIGTERILLFSQGSRRDLTLESYSQNIKWVLQKIRKAGFNNFALELPLNTVEPLGLSEPINGFFDLAIECCAGGNVTLLCSQLDLLEQLTKLAEAQENISLEPTRDES